MDWEKILATYLSYFYVRFSHICACVTYICNLHNSQGFLSMMFNNACKMISQRETSQSKNRQKYKRLIHGRNITGQQTHINICNYCQFTWNQFVKSNEISFLTHQIGKNYRWIISHLARRLVVVGIGTIFSDMSLLFDSAILPMTMTSIL